ncbi:MAG: ribonuclease T2 [Defluviimonas sp.]|uniref:ribonuclease T2 family protein n=1 Tax=Albidovulum sp. TaxID=1872424 RepID=UPI001D7E53B3|nr:ribonuclease T2 [Paracoccaceae bacterium]MCC0062485.1 ribonuclease T2 [Defluviimonas sp.]
MHRILALALSASLLAAGAAQGEGEPAGRFDYYVLSLGWSPSYCATEGDARKDDQCDPRHEYAFTLHGLWPQFESGWPSYCRTSVRPASRSETGAMTDVMGSAGLAWHEWKKHGTCAGMAARDYFDLSREAYEKVSIPDVFLNLRKDVKLPARVVEDAFIEANPGLDPTMVTVVCAAGRIDEVRICMTRDLAFRSCGLDVARDCRAADALMEAIR